MIKESPTCSRDSLRTILAIYPTLEWEAGSLDIKAAFLQGSDLTRQVFIKPPREAHSECVWKLKKAVYGLCDAPRLWFERLKQVLLSVDCIQSEADECIFLYVVDNSCNGILALHVDDIFWSGSPIFQETVLGHVHDKFLVKSSTSFPLRYLGLDISFENKVCQVNMTEYASSLQEVSVPSVDDPKSPADESLISKCRAVIGKLLGIAVQTAPYISYQVAYFTSRMSNLVLSDVHALNKMIRGLKTMPSCNITFMALSNPSEAVIYCFSDASLGNLEDGSTQGGYINFLGSKDGSMVSPLSWRSHRLKRVVRSTLAGDFSVFRWCGFCSSVPEAVERYLGS